jgi:hypothetical protein
MTGYDKELEIYILESGYFNVIEIEQRILENTGRL